MPMLDVKDYELSLVVHKIKTNWFMCMWLTL